MNFNEIMTEKKWNVDANMHSRTVEIKTEKKWAVEHTTMPRCAIVQPRQDKANEGNPVVNSF